MINRSTIRIGTIAIVAVVLAKIATANVPALKRFSGKV